MSETRKYRNFSAQHTSELVLASLRGQRSIAELCREHEIPETLLRRWREQFLAAGAERLSGKTERIEADELRRQVRQLERALGRKRWRWRSRGNSRGTWSENRRVDGFPVAYAQAAIFCGEYRAT